MTARKAPSYRQSYPREPNSLLAKHSLFSKCDPPLSDDVVSLAVEKAFARVLLDKKGQKRKFPSTPTQLVDLCFKHLKQRTDPIIGSYFYSFCYIDEIFELDAIPHEMQRQRMNIGIFYQYLLIELMRLASSKNLHKNIEAVFDGSREGDVVADITTPGFAKGLRLYVSVKKSADTVGGQDVPGVIRRLEGMAKSEMNITRPYLCAFCYATPPAGRMRNFEESRSVRFNREGHPFSENCESWEPGFTYRYITGRSPVDIYKIAATKVGDYLPFYTIEFQDECAKLLLNKFHEIGLIGSNGKIDQMRFIDFVTNK